MLKYPKEHLTVVGLSRVNRKKYWKCESNAFILPHKREYGLQPYLEYSRNCWKSHKPQWRMGQNFANDIWQFLIWAVLTEKSIKDARVLLSFCHTSETTVYWSLEVFACSRNSWKNTQARMCRGQNIAKNMYLFFILAVLTEKAVKMRA